MPLIYREYGNTVEITTYEREPSKVRVFGGRERRTVYGARRSDSVRRTRQICLRRVSSALKKFGCPLFVSCTFRGDASDARYASEALSKFQLRLRTTYSGCQSIFIPEVSPHGRIHYHGLIFQVPLSLGDIWRDRRIVSVGLERKTRVLAKLWGEGWLDCRQTDGSYRLASYISKYVTKSAGHVLFNAQHLLRISQGFPHEFVARDEYGSYFADQVADLGIPPSFEWSVDNDFLGTITKKIYREVIPMPKNPNMLNLIHGSIHG